MRRVGKLTQIYTLGDCLGFELNDGSTVSFKYGEHREGLINLLLEATEELGRIPSFEEISEYPRSPHPNTFAFYFGSFSKAIEMVEGKLRYRKWLEEREKGVTEMGKKWTKDEIIKVVMEKEKELGHCPSQKEFKGGLGLPSYPTIAAKFGGIIELRKEIEARRRAVEQILSIVEPAETATEPEIKAEEATVEATEEPIDGVEEVAAEVAIEGLVEEETIEKPAEESVEEVAAEEPQVEPEEVANEEVQEEEPVATEPVQTSVEIKDSETGKTMKIVITLEIFFPK